MIKADSIRKRWKGLADTVLRFPFSSLLFAAAAISNAIALILNEDEKAVKRLCSIILGACIAIVLQLLYERFFESRMVRYGFMIIAGASVFLYGILVWESAWKEEITIRTTVIYFILLVAFLMVPVIKSRNNFNESFMAAFKSFFVTLLFFGVLYIGVSLILAATDWLIIAINEDAYLHAANLIFLLMAPVYFLSAIPYYPGRKELEWSFFDAEFETEEEALHKKESLEKQTSPTRFLETLISYILIPITVVFTIILILYIIMNITGEFWTNSLLEPLLVAYSITVIIVYLLASTLNNRWSNYFRIVFPKVLVPVVLFQTVSSFLRIGESGVTYGRYYVILFGVFATVAGIMFSIFAVRKNGMIAPVLIGLAMLSIVPPVDAFTLSKMNQISRLETVLRKNTMLDGNTLIPNGNISKEDRQIIITSVNYLNRMNYTEDIPWLASYQYTDFEQAFGFSEYEYENTNYESFYYIRDRKEPIVIEGYDFLVSGNYYEASDDYEISSVTKDGKNYTLRFDNPGRSGQVIILEDSGGQELVRFPYDDILGQFTESKQGKDILSTEEMTFRKENSFAEIVIIAETISIDQRPSGKDLSLDANILIRLK